MSAPAYQADGLACTRDLFYALACDPARSVVVEACAGSGKTWILVSRIMRALLDGASPNEILAITFTRKAAGEMRSRLHEWIAALARASPQERIDELVHRGVSAPAAQRLEPVLASLQARVLAAGEAVQISTFHAWFAQLLRLAPTELLDSLGLQASMTLIEDIEDQKAELMRRFQRSVLEHPALLEDYTALTERHGRANLAAWLDAALDKRIEIEMADARQSLGDALESAGARWPSCAGLTQPSERLLRDPSLRAALSAAAVALGSQSAKRARDAASALVMALESTDADAAYEQARSALFTQAGTPRVLGDVAAAHAAVLVLQVLAQQIAQHEAQVDHLRMARLARVLLALWRDLKRAKGLVDMPDLERCALAVLSDSALAGWVQERLDARLHHLLIDEFQDTSPLQWHALQGWLSSYAGAGSGASGQRPPSVFIVGDPKQSIYRFRRAEPRVFNAARDFVVQGLQGHALECNHTRRCAPRVLDSVNAVFAAAQAQGDYAGFHAHSTEVGIGSPGRALHLLETTAVVDAPPAIAPSDVWRDSLTVPRLLPKEPRGADEAWRVARAVQSLVRSGECAVGDIMILARRRITLKGIAEALHAVELPCVAAEELRLADLAEVGDLDALLDALASNGHDLSLARALKSPLFGASDDELLFLAQRAAAVVRPARWWQALAQWADAPSALARARDLLARWSADSRVLPPHDLLDRIVDQGDLMARLAAAVPPERRVVALAAVNALLSQSLMLDAGRYSTTYRFVRALRQRALSVAAPTRADAIKLLTIHGAKGLQARCVFVVDTAASPARGTGPAVLVDWPVEAQSPRRVAFVAHAHQPPPSLVDLVALDTAANAREELNALYVAMTRASDILVFSRSAPATDGNAPSWWSRVRPRTEAWLRDTVDVSLGVDAVSPPRVPVLPDAVGLRPASGPQPDDGEADSSAAARLGQAMHRTLQWAAGAAGNGPGLTALAAAAVHEFGLPADAAEQVQAMVATMLASAELAPFFDTARLSWAGDEVDVPWAGECLRIDRLVRLGPPDNPVWWVLDYKLDVHASQNPSYRTQLARYRDAVRALVGQQAVRAAFATRDGRLHELN